MPCLETFFREGVNCHYIFNKTIQWEEYPWSMLAGVLAYFLRFPAFFFFFFFDLLSFFHLCIIYFKITPSLLMMCSPLIFPVSNILIFYFRDVHSIMFHCNSFSGEHLFVYTAVMLSPFACAVTFITLSFPSLFVLTFALALLRSHPVLWLFHQSLYYGFDIWDIFIGKREKI